MSRYFRDGEPDWRRIEAMARRNWDKFSGAAGQDFGNLGGGFRIGRMLASGDLRLVALYFIDLQPRHGYDLIKAVEEKSGGVYSPSPGIVYPALTYIEEAGWVTSAADGNKKLYTITEEGRAHLSDNREAIEKTLSFLAAAGERMNQFREFAKTDWPFNRGRGEEPDAPRGEDRNYRFEQRFTDAGEPEADRDLKDVLPEVNEARRELKAAIKKAKKSSNEQQHRLAEILRKAAADVRAIGVEDDDVDI